MCDPSFEYVILAFQNYIGKDTKVEIDHLGDPELANLRKGKGKHVVISTWSRNHVRIEKGKPRGRFPRV